MVHLPKKSCLKIKTYLLLSDEVSCQYCNQTYQCEANIIFEHTKTCNIVTRPDISYRFVCPHYPCNYHTLRCSHMKQHINTHYGFKMFRCPFCTYYSTQNCTLTRHLRIIHNKVNT